jgi:hypothetical protein
MLRWRWQIATALIVLVALAIDAQWIVRHRPGLPFDIDEAGHLSQAWDYAHALTSGGPVALWHAYRTPSTVGPLVALVGIPFALISPQSPTAGLFVELPFLALLLVATFFVARRVCSPAWACLAVAVTASVPSIVDMSKTDQYAIPAAALLATALWALMASDGFRRSRPALVAGLCVGLMLLARTVTIVFLPGLALVGIVALCGRPNDEYRRRLLVACGAVVLGFVIALTWYASSGKTALDWLTSVGYGQEPASTPIGVGFWVNRGAQALRELYLPLAAVLVPCGVYGVIRALRRLKQRAGVDREVAILVVLVAVGYLGLSTSANVGVGFEAPLFGPFVVLCVAGASRLPRPAATRFVALALVVASLLTVASKSDLVPQLSGRGQAALPGFGPVSVWDGRDPVEVAVARATRGGLVKAPEWRRAAHAVASLVERGGPPGTGPAACTTASGTYFNYHAIDLESRYTDGYALQLNTCVITPPKRGASANEWRRAVLVQGDPTVIVSVDGPDIAPSSTDSGAFNQALLGLSYRETDAVALPDGGMARVWKHQP